jgi:hypothetical protein
MQCKGIVTSTLNAGLVIVSLQRWQSKPKSAVRLMAELAGRGAGRAHDLGAGFLCKLKLRGPRQYNAWGTQGMHSLAFQTVSVQRLGRPTGMPSLAGVRTMPWQAAGPCAPASAPLLTHPAAARHQRVPEP